jgi:hypothetical protein
VSASWHPGPDGLGGTSAAGQDEPQDQACDGMYRQWGAGEEEQVLDRRTKLVVVSQRDAPSGYARSGSGRPCRRGVAREGGRRGPVVYSVEKPGRRAGMEGGTDGE